MLDVAVATARMPCEEHSDRNTAKVETDYFQGDGHHARFPHLVTEAGSIVLHVSNSMNEVKKDDENSEDGEEEGGPAAGRENDEISRKEAEIRRLIDWRRSTPKEEKQRMKELNKSIKKCIRDKRRVKRQQEISKTSKVSATSQESNLQKRKCSLQRLRMKEEKSLHHVKGSPMSLVNSNKKLYDDNEQDDYGNESNIDVHISDTEEMTRIPDITSEELQDAIRKLKKGKSPDSDGIREKAEDQAGLRSSYQTTHHFATYIMIEQTCHEWCVKMWIATIDFTKAFDSITHKSIWKALNSCGINHEYISLLKKFYKDQKASVQADVESNMFEIKKGTKQGDPLSSSLFNTVLQNSLKDVTQRWQKKKGIGIYLSDHDHDCFTNLRFADDVLLFATPKEQLQKMMYEFKESTEKVGLRIHPGKTKVLSNQSSIRPDSKKEMQIGDVKIEILTRSESVRYLGQLITFQHQ